MKAKSKKTGKIFTGKLANVAVKAGFADPIEEADEKQASTPVKKSAATKKPVRKTTKKPVKAAKKPVKKQVMKVKK